MLEILKADCPFTENKKIYETHLVFFLPKTCNDKLVNIVNLGNDIEH